MYIYIYIYTPITSFESRPKPTKCSLSASLVASLRATESPKRSRLHRHVGALLHLNFLADSAWQTLPNLHEHQSQGGHNQNPVLNWSIPRTKTKEDTPFLRPFGGVYLGFSQFRLDWFSAPTRSPNKHTHTIDTESTYLLVDVWRWVFS